MTHGLAVAAEQLNDRNLCCHLGHAASRKSIAFTLYAEQKLCLCSERPAPYNQHPAEHLALHATLECGSFRMSHICSWQSNRPEGLVHHSPWQL